jgi:hypothetical protein
MVVSLFSRHVFDADSMLAAGGSHTAPSFEPTKDFPVAFFNMAFLDRLDPSAPGEALWRVRTWALQGSALLSAPGDVRWVAIGIALRALSSLWLRARSLPHARHF